MTKQFGRADVFQIDAAEGRAEIAHAIDEGIRIRRVDLEIDGVDVGEALEENGLALHDGLGGERAEIAEPQDRRAVRDDGHEIALGGVVEDRVRVVGDGAHGGGHARRIGEREIPLRCHGLGGNDFELAGPALDVEAERLLVRVMASSLGHKPSL